MVVQDDGWRLNEVILRSRPFIAKVIETYVMHPIGRRMGLGILYM